jgi:hypothetical protein
MTLWSSILRRRCALGIAQLPLAPVLRRVPVNDHAGRIAPKEVVHRHPLARIHQLNLGVVGELDCCDLAAGVMGGQGGD